MSESNLTATTETGQVAPGCVCLPLSDGELEDAVYRLHVYARSDAMTFDCRTDDASDWARAAILLSTSPDGLPANLPDWQFQLLWSEYVGQLVTAMQQRGRR